jgi:DNA-binding NarL/FixJ family response regulator
MNTNLVDALVITQSIVLQQGLFALLESLPGIKKVNATRELSNLSWIETHMPQIVLLDISLSGNDPRPVLKKIKSLSPRTKRILLVDQVSEVYWVPQYAEAILIKGAPASTVATIVSDLLSMKGEENEHDHPDQ